MPTLKYGALLGALLGLAGCVSERVVLLPEPDGKPSAVIVRSGTSEKVLDEPYQTAERQGGRLVQDTMRPEEVDERFGSVIAQMPARPVSFTLYFFENSTELTPESKQLFAEVRKELAKRPVAEIMIIGHTDTVGSVQQNDAFSLTRAKTVEAALKADGIDAVMDVAGRGERELLVPTKDEVSEPRNRRVEVRVR